MRHSTVSTHRSWLIGLALVSVLLTTLACGFEGGAFGSTPVAPGATRVAAPSGSTPGPVGPAPDLSQGPAEAILITSPQPGQGARGTLRVEGLSDPALARQLNVVLRDAKGTVIATARPTPPTPADQRAAFSAELSVPPDLQRQTGRVQVYAVSPNNGGVLHLASVTVDLNGDSPATTVRIDPLTPEAIAMIFPSPNAEVKNVVKVAAATLVGPKIIIEVVDANNRSVGRLEQTVDLSAGAPAQVMAEVPIKVSAAGPGRVLVYAVDSSDGQSQHLSSVDVNLLP